MKGVDACRLSYDQLKRTCKYDQELDFCKTSLDVPELYGMIGQGRAVRSIQFSLNMNPFGYNVFVVGPPGTGKSTYVEAIVSNKAKNGPVPADWCYINNFNEKDRPIAVSLPAGQGRVFQKDIEELLSELKVLIPKAFEGSDFEQQKNTIIESVQAKMDKNFHTIEQEAANIGFNVKQTSRGVRFIPLKNGAPISSEEYDKLALAKRQALEEEAHKLEKRMDEIFHDVYLLEKQAKEQMVMLEKHIPFDVASPLILKLKEKYNEFPKITEYLEMALKDIVDNHQLFHDSSAAAAGNPLAALQEEADPFIRYKVNLFINNEKTEGAPVVIEKNPHYYNLFGKIEYKNQLMALSTDFTMIKPGAIHRANGGYLILQVKDVISEPFVWEAMKKALKYRQAVVENIGEQYRYVPTITLMPEPIPIDIKIILIGSPIYNVLYKIDEDFQKLFKVKVDFDIDMPRTKETISQYASFVSAFCRQEKLRHFSRSGIAKIIEFGSRLAGNQNKLSTRFNEITEIIYEAVNLAGTENSEYVEAAHVDRAIRERKYRFNNIEEKIQEEILQEKILIDTAGSVVGQINALSVIEAGRYAFGQPSRITAVTYMGRDGVINIERETEMSGNIHSKGVLTLAGYIGKKFAQEKSLGLTAQITFEQNYGGVEGDSASSAELYAILSSLSDVPIKQCLAVTGSVNQHGEVQPIGGATEKIEGFFDICNARRLSGEQGVIIPVQNVDTLMLKDEVIEAVKENRFHIYAVKNILEGIEILTGMPAGEMTEDGKYPEGTIFYLADKKMQKYCKGLKEETGKPYTAV